MAMENTISSDFLSTFVFVQSVFDCPLPRVEIKVIEIFVLRITGIRMRTVPEPLLPLSLVGKFPLGIKRQGSK